MSNIDPQTGLAEDASLKDRACALAMAQCATIEQPYTWLQAYHELEDLSEGDEPQSFTPCHWLSDYDLEGLYNQVQCEADAIEVQLQAAFVMGTKFSSDCAAETIHKLKEKMREVGVCPECLTVPVHQLTEPFSSCACGTGEDGALRPLQKLQRLEQSVRLMAEINQTTWKI